MGGIEFGALDGRAFGWIALYQALGALVSFLAFILIAVIVLPVHCLQGRPPQGAR